MAHIIRMVKSVVHFDKTNYTHENRSKLNAQLLETLSPAVRIHDNTLQLAPDLHTDLNPSVHHLIVIQHNLDYTHLIDESHLPKLPQTQLYGFKSPDHWNHELFAIQSNTNKPEILDIHLKYSGNELQIAYPKRTNHKVAELHAHTPIRYRLNGQSDFTMTGRKERTFTEFDFMLEYLGQATHLKLNVPMPIHTLPHAFSTSMRVVDERKMLY